MSRQLPDTRRLSAFYREVYGETASMREVLRILERSSDGEPASVKAAELYTSLFILGGGEVEVTHISF
jgi:hypothetical protein